MVIRIISKHGFTLYELVIVMAVLSIISTVGTISFLGFKQRTQVTGLANTIKADLNRAKIIASRYKSTVVLQFHEDFYEMFLDNGVGDATPDDWIREGSEARLARRDFDASVSLTSNFPGNHLRLKSGGRIRPGRLTIENRSGTKVSVVVSAVGRVRLVFSA